eukprot:8606075-Pyramimonas_sp.AAC.1
MARAGGSEPWLVLRRPDRRYPNFSGCSGHQACSLPRLCLEGFLLSGLEGPGSGNRPGRFPQYPPRGSPSCAPW